MYCPNMGPIGENSHHAQYSTGGTPRRMAAISARSTTVIYYFAVLTCGAKAKTSSKESFNGFSEAFIDLSASKGLLISTSSNGLA